jgi:hypothetical protein
LELPPVSPSDEFAHTFPARHYADRGCFRWWFIAAANSPGYTLDVDRTGQMPNVADIDSSGMLKIFFRRHPSRWRAYVRGWGDDDPEWPPDVAALSVWRLGAKIP